MHDSSKDDTLKDASSNGHRIPNRGKKALATYLAGESAGRGFDTLFYVVNVVRAVLFQFSKQRIIQRTAGVAYFMLIGFVPMVMMLIVATDLLGFTYVVGEFVVDAVIENYFPVERNQAIDAVSQLVNSLRSGYAGGIGLIAVAYAALNAFDGFYSLVNDLWQQPRRGRFLHKSMAALATMFLVPIALFASTFLTARVGGIHFVGAFASRAIAFALVASIILIVIKVMVRAHVTWRNAFVSSLIAALGFEIAKAGFAFYVREMMQGSWFSIYGAIFLIPVFMLWNLISATIIAAMASMSWVLQHPHIAFEQAGIRSALIHTTLSAQDKDQAQNKAPQSPVPQNEGPQSNGPQSNGSQSNGPQNEASVKETPKDDA